VRRKKNGSGVGLAVAGATAEVVAPLVPVVLLGGVAWWLYRKYLASAAGAAAASASEVAKAYKEAGEIAMDPSRYKQAYADAEAAHQAAGGQGSPVAQPYYGPAGEWTGAAAAAADDAASS
jgi:hypothetical protein